MAHAVRLNRLRNLVQQDLDALPDRPVSPSDSDDDCNGGVSLSPPDADSSCISIAKAPIPDKTAAQHNPERRFVWIQDVESTYSPVQPAKHFTPVAPAIELPPSNQQRGQVTSPLHGFVPIKALSKYPYKFCAEAQQKVASTFFDAGKFWAREWDLYYIWDLDELEPLVLVSESQFQDLLSEINAALQLQLTITNWQRREGLVNYFPDHPRTLPRYLGRTRSRQEYDTMIEDVPAATFDAEGQPVLPVLDNRTVEEFKQMIEEAQSIHKAKSKAQREQKQLQRLVKQKSMTDEFKRAQRYLGLRPTANGDQTRFNPPQAIDAASPVPYSFDQSVVFVCIDAESFERAHHKITEVGLATLDTRDLVGVAPGKDGNNWRSKIHARHFRIEEHKHLVNSEFVAGCPDRFDFGASEWVRLKEAPRCISECFRPPFCMRLEGNAYKITEQLNKLHMDDTRNIILLGHDTVGDVKYLQQLGYDPNSNENILEALDTAIMYRVWRRESASTSLGKILYDFDIAGFNLHNAGNDAVFTLQAMLGICVREATIRGSTEIQDIRSKDKSTRFASAMKVAEEKVRNEAEGWSDHEADGDGGEPVSMAATEITKPVSSGSANGSHTPSARGRGRGRGYGRGDLQQSSFGSRGRSRAGDQNSIRGANCGGHYYSDRTQTNRRDSYRGGSQTSGIRQDNGHHSARGRRRGRVLSEDDDNITI